MRIRTLLLSIAVLLGGAVPVAAQQSAHGRAILTVPDLLEVRVAEAGDVLEVEVVANRAWELEAVLEGEGGRWWSAGTVAEGGAGRQRVAVSYARLVEKAGASVGSTVRFTLGPR